MVATALSTSMKTEVIGMHQVGGWQVLPLILLPGSHCGKVNLAYFVLVVTLMRMTLQDCPLWKIGSSSGCGAR